MSSLSRKKLAMSIVSSQLSGVSTEYSVLSTQYSVLSCRVVRFHPSSLIPHPYALSLSDLIIIGRTCL